MKNSGLLIYLAITFFTVSASHGTLAQSTKNTAPSTKQAPQKTTVKPVIKACYLPADTTNSTKLMLSQLKDWTNDLPLKVTCDQKNSYELRQFELSIITMSPMQSRDFGMANNGIPILARKAIDQMKQGDTVFLKNLTGVNKDGQEVPLPNIAISVIDPPAATLEMPDQQD